VTARRLGALLDNCARHLRYLMAARERLPRPMLAGHFEEPSDDLVAALDQFAFRFTRLQDTMGARLVEKLKEPYEDAPLLDVLDRLEALRRLESADAWERIRAMRNTLAHDYPESAEEKAAALNLAIGMAAQMEAILRRFRE
jgi:hypothetical protein